LTTVPSMNAMLEPRMLATSIQRSVFASQRSDGGAPCGTGSCPRWLVHRPRVYPGPLLRAVRRVFAFLTRHGIDTTAVQLQALEVSDADANRFPSERAGPRFVIQQTVIVRSRAPDVVMAEAREKERGLER
jgi:hypothetical protein